MGESSLAHRRFGILGHLPLLTYCTATRMVLMGMHPPRRLAVESSWRMDASTNFGIEASTCSP